MPSLRASDNGQVKIQEARNKKGLTTTEDSEALPEARRIRLREALWEKGWTLEEGLTYEQIQKLIQDKVLDKKWTTSLSPGQRLSSEQIEANLEAGEPQITGISYGTWNDFLRGNAIKTHAFKSFCLVLDLDWEEIHAGSSTQQTATFGSKSASDKGQIRQEFDDGETRWVGRETLITNLIKKLQGECRVLSIVGITGIGKTSLAAELTRKPEILQLLPELKTASFYQDSPQFEVVARQVLGHQTARSQHLQTYPDAMVAELQSQPCLLVIDMIEEALEADGKGGHQFKEQAFTKFLERVVKVDVMPSRIILTSQDQPPVVAEGRYPERLHTELLKGLSDSEAKELFKVWDVRIQEDADLDYLNRIISVYEGHPLALKVIAGEIRDEPYQGDVQAYWNDYGHEIEEVERMKNAPEPSSREDKPRLDRYSTKLTDLVQTRIEKSFERLHRACPVACLLFCMGAMNRRATERRAWLFLIGEYSREEQESAFQTLERRLLLETEKQAKKIFYRLHSLNRRVALDNLPKLEEEVLLA